MAKKQTVAKKATPKPVVETTNVVETPVVKPTVEVIEKPINKWEIKDRIYYLTNNRKPLSKSIKSSNVYWFDQEKGYEREIKYCENQKTNFVDEMQGDQRLSHIIFRNGSLFVPKEKTVLQKMLSLYHPDRDRIYYEHKPVEEAADELTMLELEIEALDLARDLDVDMLEAIMRAEVGSSVSSMSSKELKRDALLFARNNPELFLELANDDNVQLRNFGIRAAEANIIKLSQDQRHFMWGSTDRKLMTVPFDEHPYSALAQWFKTDEGMEVYTNIEKRLS